jgi:tetratricopeptide (TPR) repeat protein
MLLPGCSSERNTWTSKAYHNTTAHFNGYYYALNEIEKVEQTIRKSQVDDYNRILRLFPTFDTTLANSYEKEIQEAIKMASIAIQRHPNSKWVDDAYILVGKARLYTLDWGNAIQTFKHVNTKSKDKDAKHLAIVNLIRTYVEHQEFNNAQAAIDYLQKTKLSKVNEKKFNLEKAYYYQLLDDYDKMVRSLTQADPLLKKKDRRGRIYFIIGQVYQKLGFEAEAYNYYRKCLSTNPEYEVDFYARLYMAQVTEISRSRDINAARKSFRKLLKDSKNKEFHDKIYYEMGIFELKQSNFKEAIEDFNLSVRRGTNKRIDGEAFVKLGEIYYDSLRDYKMAQAYYDSAIISLPSDFEGWAIIKARQETLNEFVKHLNTIEWQDSLLAMASLDSTTLRARVDSIVTAKAKEKDEKAKKKKKKNNRVEITGNENSSIFNNDNNNASGTDWYFGNVSAMAIGQTEFARVWGNVPLEDNWRRSQRASTRNTSENQNNQSVTTQTLAAETKPDEDPVTAEFNKLAAELPRTAEQREQALAKIEEAYFKLAGIYYFKLEQNNDAVNSYLKLLERFPSTSFEPEALYTLYLIYKDADPAAAEQYASLLKRKHPSSSFARILINPDYLKESSQAAEKQKLFYKEAYEKFKDENFIGSLLKLDEAFALGETSFTPSLQLLRILITGETEDVTLYQYELGEFIKANEGKEIATYAKKLLDSSREFQSQAEKRKGIQYVKSFDEPHYFVMIYKRTGEVGKIASSVLETFNRTYFTTLNLKTSNLILNEEYALTFVADLPEVRSAVEYFKTFIENQSRISELRNHKFDNFVITRDNFNIFYRTKGLDEYLQFFQKNYKTENP